MKCLGFKLSIQKWLYTTRHHARGFTLKKEEEYVEIYESWDILNLQNNLQPIDIYRFYENSKS